MAKKKPIRRKVAISSSSESDDDDYEVVKKINDPKRVQKNIPPIQQEPEVMGVASDNEFDGDGDEIMKIAEDVVDKNAKLTKLFDPAVMAGFTMLMKKSERVGESTKAMEACAKVYQQKVDYLYNGVNKVCSAMVKVKEKKAEKTEKKVTIVDENLDYWLTDKDAVIDEQQETQTLFSGDEEESANNNRTDMTVVDFRKDQTVVGPTDLNLSAELEDTSELAKKVKAFCKDRRLLTNNRRLTLEQLEVRFERADQAALKYMASERAKMFGGLKSKKGVEKERKDYTELDYPLFSHAMIQKRENAHVSLDDVAVTNDDCSLTYLHNHWKEIEETPLKMAEEVEDWVVDDKENFEDGVDVVSSILEHLQGTFENATSEDPVLPDEIIDIFGLEKKDLKKVKHLDAYCNVSFEQTACKNIDESKMIDQLENAEEEEEAKKELQRLDDLTTELFKDRENLLENAQNPREMSIRQEMHRPKYTSYYDDEDRFFNYDFRKYITKESLNKEISETAKVWVSSLTEEYAVSIGINEKIFKIIRNTINNKETSITTDILNAFDMIPDTVFGKLLLINYHNTTSFYEEVKLLEMNLLPFRVSRYAQYVVSSVLHESLVADLEDGRSRVTSSLSYRSITTPKKKPRLDDTTANDGYVYFYGIENQPTQRYPGQKISLDSYETILKKIVEKMEDERYLKMKDKGKNDPILLDAFWATLTLIGYFKDHKNNDDLTDAQVIDVNTIEDDDDNEFDVEMDEVITSEQEIMLNNLVERFDDVPTSLDYDDMDIDNDFITARNTPIDEPTLNENLYNDALSGIEHQSSPIKSIFSMDDDNNNDENQLNDSLALMIKDYNEDVDIINVQQNSKSKLKTVEDTAHYDDNQKVKKVTKKKKKEVEKDDKYIDEIAFAPRDTFTNVSTRRGRSKTPVEHTELQNILRNMDITFPDKLTSTIGTRIDDQLTMTIPGFNDPDRMFVCLPLPNTIKTTTLYKGKYSNLPPTAKTRQEYDLLHLTKYHKLVRDIEKTKITSRSGTSHSNYVEQNDLQIDDDINNDPPFYDALDDGNSISLRTDLTNVNDFYKEYGNVDSDLELDEEEDDDFDFDASMKKHEAKRNDNQFKYHLKRAIRFILSRAFLDRMSIQEDIDGIKPPENENALEKNKLVNIAKSTPTTKKKSGNDNFEFMIDDAMDDEILTGFEDCVETEEEVPDDETDETRMPPFKIKGFHTFRSVLYYLPKYCLPETVEILSTAHVFSIICHMVNENSLHLSQDMYDDDDIENRNDYVIENYEDYEKRLNEFELDDIGVTSAEDLM